MKNTVEKIEMAIGETVVKMVVSYTVCTATKAGANFVIRKATAYKSKRKIKKEQKKELKELREQNERLKRLCAVENLIPKREFDGENEVEVLTKENESLRRVLGKVWA